MKKININKKWISDYYLADYFNKTSEIISKKMPNQKVTMQWFQRENNVIVCGLNLVIQILKETKNYNQLEIYALNDGDIINAKEPVLKITGKYSDFGYLEGIIDSILARSSGVATISKRLVDAANNKIILNMNDRSDFFINHELDGYSSYIGGIKKFVTPSAIEWIDDITVKKPEGTMPHALIQAFKGNLIEACYSYMEIFPANDLVALVDYNNDCINDSLLVAKEFGEKLKFVRVDTSDALIDKSLKDIKDINWVNGVNPTLIKFLRAKLDDNGYNWVKIIVSSGFDEIKIKKFEEQNTPVDVYGVGETLTSKKIGFTGDAVMINGVKESKFGRELIDSGRLKIVK